MNDQLLSLRQQIDTIDEQLIGLLKQRIGIVERVGELKNQSTPHLCPIRAGREARMIRQIVERFKGSHFSAVNAAAIWRLIIGASTHVESPLTISVLHNETEQGFIWLAREYFGPCITLIRQPNVKRVIGDVMENKAAIGLVPRLLASENNDWWGSLLQESADAPKIFASVPFILTEPESARMPQAFAIARLMPEDSGDDISFYALHTVHDLSQNRMQSCFTEAGISAQWHAIESPSTDYRLHLVELAGFIAPDHPGLEQFKETLGTSLIQASFLGAYAVPFAITNDQNT